MGIRELKMRPQEIGFEPEIQIRRTALKEALRGKLLNPCPGSVYAGVGIGVDFGYTLMPGKHSRQRGRYRFHKGVDMFDFSKKPDEPGNEKHNERYGDVLAMFDGVIVFAGKLSDDYGNTVIVEHALEVDGERLSFFTLVCHCHQVYWDIGEAVEKGDAIAESGKTGNAVAVHQHVEVRLLENASDAVCDPVPCFYGLKEKGGGAYWEDQNPIDGVIMREHSADY